MERRTVSTSKEKTYTGCRKKYWFIYDQGLRPIVTAAQLSFGRLLHACLEAFYLQKKATFEKEITAWEKECLASVAKAPNQAHEFEIDRDKIEEMKRLATGIMLGYVKRYSEDLRRFEILGVEKRFKFPMQVPCHHCKGVGCDKCQQTGLGRKSPLWLCEGVLDLVVRETAGNGAQLVWIMEHKTSANDLEKYMDQIILDPQPRVYSWAMARVAAEYKYGKVAGIIYNLMRKKIPARPKTVQCRTCKGQGIKNDKDCPKCDASGVGGISKTIPDSTVDIFVKEVNRFGHLKISDYENQIAALTARGDRFFRRQYHFVSDADIRDWQIETYNLCREMASAHHFPRNTSNCFFPFRCPYVRVCLEDSPAARQNFTTREDRAITTLEPQNVQPFTF